MIQNTKREYLPPQIEQMLARVEKGYEVSGQDVAVTGDNAIHFVTDQGSWD